VEQPITPAKLLFFRTLAPSIEGLTLLDPEGEDTKKKGLVTRLLAVPAPNLHLLKYGCGKADSSVLCGLTKQSQLQSLKLEVGWSPRTSRRIADWQSLKSLQNLEVPPPPPHPRPPNTHTHPLSSQSSRGHMRDVNVSLSPSTVNIWPS